MNLPSVPETGESLMGLARFGISGEYSTRASSRLSELIRLLMEKATGDWSREKQNHQIRIKKKNKTKQKKPAEPEKDAGLRATLLGTRSK